MKEKNGLIGTETSDSDVNETPEANTTPEMPEMTDEQKAQMEEAMEQYRQSMREQQAHANFQRLIRTRKVQQGRKKGRKKRL